MPSMPSRARSSSTSSSASGQYPASREDQLTPALLQSCMREVAEGVAEYDSRRLVFVRSLQEAVRNHGWVLMMRDRSAGGRPVAVKKMPRSWTRGSHAEFEVCHQGASEKPWVDLGILRHLNSIGYPHACQLHGVFAGSGAMYAVTSLATEGDLFSWCLGGPELGGARERQIQPVAVQICAAVRWLHDLGIAHRDLSLENLLLTREVEAAVGQTGPVVKVIDFGMATLSGYARRESRGKPAYQAPETHLGARYSTFLADIFSVGVVLFCLASQDYPWESTRRGACTFFDYVHGFGLRRFLQRRRSRKASGESLGEVLSEDLVALLEGLLTTAPERRLTLGEGRFRTTPHGSVRGCRWLAADEGSATSAVLDRWALLGPLPEKLQQCSGVGGAAAGEPPVGRRTVACRAAARAASGSRSALWCPREGAATARRVSLLSVVVAGLVVLLLARLAVAVSVRHPEVPSPPPPRRPQALQGRIWRPSFMSRRGGMGRLSAHEA